MDGRPLRPAVALLAFAALVGCGKKQSTLLDAGAPVDAEFEAQAPPPPRVRRDCRLQPGQVSEDDHPTLAGVGEAVVGFEWLAAHGVTKEAASRWYIANLSRDPDDNSFGGPCSPFEVSSEAGIVCLESSRESMMRIKAIAIVIRNKQPVVVLTAYTSIEAMDWPESRELDLQLAFAPDGKSVELRDRAPDGSQLVESPRQCEESEKQLEQRGASPEPSSESGVGLGLGSGPGAGNGLRNATIGASKPPVLHDCAEATTFDEKALKDEPPAEIAEARKEIAFVRRMCAARGTYKWSGGRYVKGS